MDPVKENPVKYDIKAEEKEFLRYIETIKTVPETMLTSYTPADDKNHFVIYKFTLSGDKCVIVYDTKACKVSLTARADVLEKIKTILFASDNMGDGKSMLPSHRKQHDRSVVAVAPKQNLPQKHGAVKQQVKPQSKRPQKPSSRPADAQVKPQQNTASQPKAPMPAESETPEYKNGYAIKKYSKQRLVDALAAIKAMRSVSYKSEPTVNKGKQDETQTYIVSDKNAQKVILRYLPKKEILQMQGKRSYLFSEVQVLVLKGSDFREAVSSHIVAEKGGSPLASAANAQRRLKKILPCAFDFLSEQSKIDLTIGLIDINNTETRLSDYSSLLTPPYRGLEKFISDLQKAKGIDVKMIGQGYEKDEFGNYRLKSGYRKRIDSVVFNEVMSALYTEYFARRNFYTHSDVTDESAARIITDKSEVKRIFDNLIAVIDYNSKKLKEIGFSVK